MRTFGATASLKGKECAQSAKLQGQKLCTQIHVKPCRLRSVCGAIRAFGLCDFAQKRAAMHGRCEQEEGDELCPHWHTRTAAIAHLQERSMATAIPPRDGALDVRQ